MSTTYILYIYTSFQTFRTLPVEVKMPYTCALSHNRGGIINMNSKYIT